MLELVDLLAPFFAPYSEKDFKEFEKDYNETIANFKKNPQFKNVESCKLDSDADFKFAQKDGSVTIDVIVTGHNPEDVKVKWNENEHILKIVDETNVPEENRPWYYHKLNMKFELPETTVKESFVKKNANGVLTVSVKYEPDDDTKAMPASEIEIL